MVSARCAVPGCGNKLSLHILPKHPDVREKWIQFIFNKCPSNVNPQIRVCSLHFTVECFVNKQQYDAGFARRLLLGYWAVPTVSDPRKTQATNTQQTSAENDVHSLDDPNKTAEIDVDEDFSDQDSVTSSVDSTAEEMFIDGLDPVLDQSSTDVLSSAQDWDLDAGLHQRKRLGLFLTPASPEKCNEGNKQESQFLPDVSSGDSDQRWHNADEADDEPPQPVFTPVQTPGLKFQFSSCNSPLKFFQLFFSDTVLQEIVDYTNVYGTKCQTTEEQWDQIARKELESFIALVIFMGLFRCSSLHYYWQGSEFFGLCFPRQIMSYQRFLAISNALHLNDPKEDEENNKRMGTSDYKHLGEVPPLYQIIREACKTFFHPFQNITITERMVTSRARTRLRNCIENEFTNNGYKLFALSDCTTSYTWDFIYDGKSCASQSHGLSYESVMALVDDSLLGTGYKLFVDKFYTSPTLFRDLLHKDVWACGPSWSNRKGFPNPNVNRLRKNAPRGTMRWIRDNKLLLVRWKDAQEVQICSTFHKAYGGDTVQRKVKRDDGTWTLVDIPIPAAVLDYDRYMESDSSNCVTGHFRHIHKPGKWYQCVFYHILDIAVENAFILQELTAKAKNKKAMNRQAFLEMLILKLTARDTTHTSAPSSPASFHKPKHITQNSTAGGEKCQLCHQETTVMCVTCDVMLCFHPQRDCFNDWHEKQGL